MSEKEKSTKKETAMSQESQERATSVGGMPKRASKPVESPEFLSKGPQRSLSSKDLFSEIFEEDMRVEEFDLPSRGLPYNWESGTIKIRPYQTSEQKIISTLNKNNYNMVLNKLMSACIVYPSPKEFPVTEYTIGDGVAILFWLRVSSWNPLYQYSGIVCDDCGKKNIKVIEFDLTTLDFAYLEEKPPEPIEVKINDRVNVFVNLLRRKDELEAQRIVKRLEKIEMMREGDEWLQKYVTCTDSIEIDGMPYEGSMDHISLMKFYEQMPSRHLEKIDKVHEKYIHGIKTAIDYVCPFCDSESEKMLPLDPSFFFQGL